MYERSEGYCVKVAEHASLEYEHSKRYNKIYLSGC